MLLLRVHSSGNIGCLGYICRVVNSKQSASSHVAAPPLTANGPKSVLKKIQVNFRCNMLASSYLPRSRCRTQVEDEKTYPTNVDK